MGPSSTGKLSVAFCSILNTVRTPWTQRQAISHWILSLSEQNAFDARHVIANSTVLSSTTPTCASTLWPIQWTNLPSTDSPDAGLPFQYPAQRTVRLNIYSNFLLNWKLTLPLVNHQHFPSPPNKTYCFTLELLGTGFLALTRRCVIETPCLEYWRSYVTV